MDTMIFEEVKNVIVSKWSETKMTADEVYQLAFDEIEKRGISADDRIVFGIVSAAISVLYL